ncbi:MAG: OmpH family outer membrane protein [Rhodospirillales bacterium]|nr:OmpH family outer membrane protein [Rhodospirillales bacterium]
MQGWRRLWLLFALTVACAVGSNTSVWADEHGTRVAVIEMVRVLSEATAIHSIRTQGEAQRKSYAEDTQRESERLRGVRDELQQQATLLTPAVLEERQRAFNAEVSTADQRAKARGEILQRAVTEGEIRFREVLGIVVGEVATEQGIDLVLPVHETIFAAAEFNLTDMVIERLNEAYPEIVLTFDEN